MKSYPAPPPHVVAAHQAALQMIYALEVGGQSAEQIERWYLQAHPLAPAVRESALGLVESAAKHRTEIQDLITKHAVGFRLERISMVDRCLLMMGVAEMLMSPSEPANFVAQPMLYIARRFSVPGSIKFLHGVFHAIATEFGRPLGERAVAPRRSRRSSGSPRPTHAS